MIAGRESGMGKWHVTVIQRITVTTLLSVGDRPRPLPYTLCLTVTNTASSPYPKRLPRLRLNTRIGLTNTT